VIELTAAAAVVAVDDQGVFRAIIVQVEVELNDGSEPAVACK